VAFETRPGQVRGLDLVIRTRVPPGRMEGFGGDTPMAPSTNRVRLEAPAGGGHRVVLAEAARVQELSVGVPAEARPNKRNPHAVREPRRAG